MWLGMGLVTGFCEHCDELLVAIKCGKFPDQLSDCKLLKKESAQWSSNKFVVRA
jgi:hypothetical protein